VAENLKPEHAWRAIAKEIAAQRDCEKIVKLSQDLIEALDREIKEPLPQTVGQQPQKSQSKTA